MTLPQHPARNRIVTGGTVLVLLAAVAGLQAARESAAPVPVTRAFLYVQSPGFVRRAALSYKSLAADVYWMRALQHYGRTKLDPRGRKEYELLYPLLDLTTSLDPHFNIAYRFGSIFLAEPAPGGAGRPDLAVTLLEKGLAAQPERWELAQDVGFVYYWWGHDYQRAADWFTRAASIKGAPDWMSGLAAVTRAKGGDRESSRRLWNELLTTADEEWLRGQAAFRLQQLDALDQIDGLQRAVRTYHEQRGAWPPPAALGGVTDPRGFPYRLDPLSGRVTLDPASPLNPLPVEETAAP